VEVGPPQPGRRVATAAQKVSTTVTRSGVFIGVSS
jgi:hypothetical protein